MLHNNNLSTNGSELEAILRALIAGARYGIKIRLPHAFVMTFLFKRNLTAQQKLKAIMKVTFEHASNLSTFAALYKTLLAILKLTSQRLNPSSASSTNKLVRLGQTLLLTLLDGPVTSKKHWKSFQKQPTSIQMVPPGVPQHPYHSFLAGLIGGYTVWGHYSSVNYQIVLYLTSRVLAAMTTLGIQKLHRTYSSYSTSTQTQSNMVQGGPVVPSWLTLEKGYPYLAASVWGAVMVLFETYPEALQFSLKKSMDEVYRSERGKT